MNIYDIILSDTHTLIAGTTGSGKSVLLRGIIKHIPRNAAIVLIDPKIIEFREYRYNNNVVGYADNIADTVKLLVNSINIMNERYKRMSGRICTETPIYIIIDELADLIISGRGKEIKTLLQKLLQLARGCNIKLIMASQCPSKKILTAEILLNCTCRVGLHCMTAIESRQIIGVKGCENLPRYGKAIIAAQGYIFPMNIPPE